MQLACMECLVQTCLIQQVSDTHQIHCIIFSIQNKRNGVYIPVGGLSKYKFHNAWDSMLLLVHVKVLLMSLIWCEKALTIQLVSTSLLQSTQDKSNQAGYLFTEYLIHIFTNKNTLPTPPFFKPTEPYTSFKVYFKSYIMRRLNYDSFGT